MDSDTPDSLHESGSQAALLLGLRVLSLLGFGFLGFVLWVDFWGCQDRFVFVHLAFAIAVSAAGSLLFLP